MTLISQQPNSYNYYVRFIKKTCHFEKYNCKGLCFKFHMLLFLCEAFFVLFCFFSFFFLFFLFLCLRQDFSVFLFDCPGTHSVVQAGLELRDPNAGEKSCATRNQGEGGYNFSCKLVYFLPQKESKGDRK